MPPSSPGGGWSNTTRPCLRNELCRLTKAQEQRVDGDRVHVEERGRNHPRADRDNDHGQPFVVEDGRLVDERELLDRLQRFVELEVERCYGGAGYDDLSDEKYEVRHLHTNNNRPLLRCFTTVDLFPVPLFSHLARASLNVHGHIDSLLVYPVLRSALILVAS